MTTSYLFANRALYRMRDQQGVEMGSRTAR
jgi:hypothetical protein